MRLTAKHRGDVTGHRRVFRLLPGIAGTGLLAGLLATGSAGILRTRPTVSKALA